MLLNTPTVEIENLLEQAQSAFHFLKKKTVGERAAFMETVAGEIEKLDDELIKTAQAETNLPEARLRNEKARTVLQWRSYAKALASGVALEVRIETKDPANTLKPDLRKTYTPLGVVVVFGASNFPFAYSTLGGDTASAIAAGCPVILNAHPAHQQTSVLMAKAIEQAIKISGYPTGIFSHVLSSNHDNGQFLVKHPLVKAVGFTGSFTGGKALFDLANQRKEPIPVFAEMGSVNPVFVLSQKLKNDTAALAQQYVASLTLGVGQFCTNPGIIIIPNNEATSVFLSSVKTEAEKVVPALMLHSGIAKTYHEKTSEIIRSETGEIIAQVKNETSNAGNATIVMVSAQEYLKDEKLSHEVFGPFGLVVTYDTDQELQLIAESFCGQLTASIWAETEELKEKEILLSAIEKICGRFILNGFPTGVEVATSMQHGGPYPSTTDSRFSSVGGDAIRRFARPISLQNWPNEFLPAELQNENPLTIWRNVNGELTKESISA